MELHASSKNLDAIFIPNNLFRAQLKPVRSSTVEFSQSVSRIQTLHGQTLSKNASEIMLICQQNTGMKITPYA